MDLLLLSSACSPVNELMALTAKRGGIRKIKRSAKPRHRERFTDTEHERTGEIGVERAFDHFIPDQRVHAPCLEREIIYRHVLDVCFLKVKIVATRTSTGKFGIFPEVQLQAETCPIG